MFKLQVQDDDNDASIWHDVKGPGGALLTFEKISDARARLEALFPILVKMERYAAGPKRTRVIAIIKDDGN
jgi:ClpP class serine protease